MSRLLLTGGTGFLGSHLAEAFVAGGHDLVASVRATSDTRWLDPLGVETTLVDLGRADPGQLEELLGRFDAVVHCGALTKARDEAQFMAVNSIGTERLAAAAARAGVGRFVFISSLAACGPDGTDGPISPYGRSKADAERRLEAFASDMEVITLRPGGVYGPRDSDLLPLFSMATKGWVVIPRSEHPLQPVYVSDVVSATVAALSASTPPGPLPVAHDAHHTWSDLATALGKAVGRDARIVRLPGSVFWTVGFLSELAARLTRTVPAMDRRSARDMSHHCWTCDVDDTRAALGWEPRIDIDRGLALTAEWYREQGWL